MLWQDCKVGMTVKFGRPNGEKTLAEVVRVNPSRAKLKTLEERGQDRPAGQVWQVPVMLTVLPDNWSSDHWTIVRGIDDQVHLTNYQSLTLKQFKAEWFSPGEGIVIG